MARYLDRKIRQTDGFIPDKFEDRNICFWYVPPSLRGKENEPDFWDKLSKIPPIIKSRAKKEGTMIISYQPLCSKNWVNFLRVVVQAIPTLTEK
nr:cysteine sulfinic acid decarboxylase-like [Parasteatoda tepidariorum]